MRVSRAVAAAAVVLFGTAYAQCDEVVPGQYLGTPFANGLPLLNTLSSITFFKIKDPSGAHVCTDDPLSDLSLLAFQSLNSSGGRTVNENIQRAIIVLHGALDDPMVYHNSVLTALKLVAADGINPDNVAVTAPYFPDDGDAGVGYPVNNAGTTPAETHPSRALVWFSDSWSGGAINTYPANTTTVSTFDVLDQMIQYYANKTAFPNLEQIVLAGHSMGGQLLHKYAAVGYTPAQLGIDTPVTYWIGDPDSFLWLDDTRPLSISKCPTFANWREGIENYAEYGNTTMYYNIDLVNQGAAALQENFFTRNIAYARASLDKGNYNPENDCSPYTTGGDRNERFFEFIHKFGVSCPDPLTPGGLCSTVDIVNVSHSAPKMFMAVPGLARLFTDNWNGNGSRLVDFGYPRHASYDDPYPDPAQLPYPLQPLVDNDATVYAGNQTSKGCWTDADLAQTNATFPYQAYYGTLTGVTYCTSLCASQGYTITGVHTENCYCGDSLTSEAANVVVSSCENACPNGDTTGFCGGNFRVSVYASVEIPGEYV